jgi:hypothetical protein
LTRYAAKVIAMTDLMITRTSPSFDALPAGRWRMRGGLVALSAAVVVATVFGPGPVLATTRLGAGETVGLATVSAADTITSSDVLAEVAAGVRDRVSKIH